MGCSASTPETDGTRPAKKRSTTGNNAAENNVVLPEVTWQTDRTWAAWLLHMEKSSIEAGRHDEFIARYSDMVFFGARMRFEEQYPDCAAAGTIGDLGTRTDLFSDESNEVPCKHFLISDASNGCVVHVFALVVAKPLRRPTAVDTTSTGKDEDLSRPLDSDSTAAAAAAAQKQQTEKDMELPWTVPGAMLDSHGMRIAKRFIVTTVAQMRSSRSNMDHAVLHIFMGADLVTCRFNASPKSPTITRKPKELVKQGIKANKNIAKIAKKAPNEFRGIFESTWFCHAVHSANQEYPGSTVWDEGLLPLKLPGGAVHPGPTRLLVTRVFSEMTGDKVDEVYVTATAPPLPGSSDKDEPVKLVRKVDPSKEPGGIVKITLVIGISPDVVWPNTGDYAKSPILKAGEEAVLEYAKRLHVQRKLDRCSIRVYMGLDESWFHLVGDPRVITGEERETRLLPDPEEMDPFAAPATTALPADDGSLARDFHLEVSPQRRHGIMESESQFQAIKQYVTGRHKDRTPQESNAIAIMGAPMAAKHWLEVNFPGLDISIEGPFPVVLPDGTETHTPDTSLVVARDPKQEPRSVVAVIQTVACPAGRDAEPSLFSTRTWVNTPEMEEADKRLLALLKRWHAEGKVSELDCMAQSMLAKDASIYKFVDGERFEDYSDERMQQLNWG